MDAEKRDVTARGFGYAACSRDDEGNINVWIEPWGISLSSPNADYLAGWFVVKEKPRV